MNTVSDAERRPPITRDAVVYAALAIIDDLGLDGLTMRRLGTALSADPMAAYLHFPNKAALVDAVVDREAARLFDIPTLDHPDPVELLVAVGCHYRSLLLEHPNLASLIASRVLPADVAAAGLMRMVRLLRAAGFPGEAIPPAVDATVTYTFGFVLHEAVRASRARQLGIPAETQHRAVLDAIVDDGPDADAARAVVHRRLKPDAAGENFAAGLRALILGLRAGLGHRATV